MDELEIRSSLFNYINMSNSLISNNLKHDYKYLKERRLYFELKDYVDGFIESCNPDLICVSETVTICLEGVEDVAVFSCCGDYSHGFSGIGSQKRGYY